MSSLTSELLNQNLAVKSKNWCLRKVCGDIYACSDFRSATLELCCPKCGSSIHCLKITQKLVRNTESQAPPQTLIQYQWELVINTNHF